MAYSIAIEKLSEKEMSQLDPDMLSSCTVHSVLAAANKAIADHDENKWRFTNKQGKQVILRERFDRIILGLAKYAGLIGKATQHQQPQATGLVWVAAQSLIEVYHICSSHSMRLLTCSSGIFKS
jgi:hypothetical protein